MDDIIITTIHQLAALAGIKPQHIDIDDPVPTDIPGNDLIPVTFWKMLPIQHSADLPAPEYYHLQFMTFQLAITIQPVTES